MRKKVILITGASGEIGQALIESLSSSGRNQLVTLDLKSLPANLQGLSTHIEGDILDKNLFARLITEYDLDIIFHLAALLSSRSEFSPGLAHRVNVDGTLSLLELAAEQSQRRGQPVKFIFPSSIAAYGMPNLATKARDRVVKEWDWNQPSTMYGCNKLYCEMLGTYYSQHFQQMAYNRPVMLDFRSVRFPGLISAFTLPTGGTTDYGPEMIHAAAQGNAYDCFVRAETVLPFMAMPDAIKSLLQLSQAPREALSRTVYNVTSFSVSASQIYEKVKAAFPQAEVSFTPDLRRQGIVDSWPAEMNDNLARRDWGWEPDFGFDRAFNEYLIPNIRQRYAQVGV